MGDLVRVLRAAVFVLAAQVFILGMGAIALIVLASSVK